MTANKIYDVLIIGAGPVGLATALGLYARGIQNILVIDQTRSFRKAGQTVDLLPNGLKALKCISEQAYQNFKSVSLTATDSSKKKVWSDRNLAGQVIRSFSLNFDDWFNQYGEGRISIPWYEIQTQLRNLLPPDIIKIDNRCININQKNNTVSVDCISNQSLPVNPFAHWDNSRNEENNSSKDNHYDEPSQHSFQAKLVVAADGINSTIREILYKNTDLEKWAKPQFSGYGAIGCFTVENIPDETTNSLENNYLQRDRVVTIKPEVTHNYARIILLRKDTNTFGYLIHAPIELDTILNSSPEELINVAQKTLNLAGYPDAFLQLINLSNPEQLITRPYYIHPVDLPVEQEIYWSSGRVVLVGDAAHGMPPFIAQGTNQGFEDALMIVKQLNHLIKSHDLEQQEKITQAFQEYEKERRPFISQIQSATMKSHLWNQQEWTRYGEQVYNREFTP